MGAWPQSRTCQPSLAKGREKRGAREVRTDGRLLEWP